ncbi:MAG: CheR family methyltransferase [Solirubrobacteraceae bacterium]
MSAAPATGTLEDLLEFVKSSRGFDFTGYKRSSIQRRVSKRMAELGVDRYDDYIDQLELHSDEFGELFNTLLINVTSFFRDPSTWEYMATEVIPELIAARAPDAPLRIWCAGCASGEEAYTIAMVFARVLGDTAFRERVKIYATDIDEQALDQARHGAYQPRQLEGVPREALDRFFERTDQRYVFRKDLRRSVIFGRNDLVQDAPISRIDLLVCRNTLMYFTAETQAQILRRLHFALRDDGILLLGRSEMLITHSELFTPADLKWRVFRKVIKQSLRDRVHALAADPAKSASQSIADNLLEAAFDAAAAPHVVLDAERVLVMANAAARTTFGIRAADLGKPVQDLELSYRPAELRAHLDHLVRDARVIQVDGVRWATADRERMFDVHLVPLLGDEGLLGTSVVYEDVTTVRSLQNELIDSKHELEQAYEELQSTVEELETTNEELQSTNEELETTNEELQSTNEELETMNEELQSANEELETMNDELRHRTLELNEMNAFLETVLATMGLAVAVLNRRQCVQIWNGQAREMWGISADEATNQHLFSLDIGLPVDRLKAPLKAVLAGESTREELVLDAVNRRGRAFQCRVLAMPLITDGDGEVSGVIMLMEPAAEEPPAG